MANSNDPDQTTPIGAVCSGSTLFTSILNLLVMLGNHLSRRLQQTTFSDACILTHLNSQMDMPTLIRRTSSFPILGVLGGIFHFSPKF